MRIHVPMLLGVALLSGCAMRMGENPDPTHRYTERHDTSDIRFDRGRDWINRGQHQQEQPAAPEERGNRDADRAAPRSATPGAVPPAAGRTDAAPPRAAGPAAPPAGAARAPATSAGAAARAAAPQPPAKPADHRYTERNDTSEIHFDRGREWFTTRPNATQTVNPPPAHLVDPSTRQPSSVERANGSDIHFDRGRDWINRKPSDQ